MTSVSEGARLFVAIRFPEEVRSGVWNATGPLREAGGSVRWTPVGQLHITLRFLGNVPIESIGVIDERLGEAAARCVPFTLSLGGVGGFPSLRRPRVLWVRAEGGPELSALHGAVEGALEACGFEPGDRRFKPHVTIGRIRGMRRGGRRQSAAGATAELTRAAAAIDFHAEVDVDLLHLMESRLSPAGARHTVTGEYPLGRSDD